MILAPFRRIERLSDPIATQPALATEGFLYSDRNKHLADTPLRLSSPMHFSCGALAISGDTVLVPGEFLEEEISVVSGGPVPLSETRTSFVEDLAVHRATDPNPARPVGCCNVGDLEYRALFGPNGSIQRCKGQFIESRFNPRKAVRLICRDVRAHDFGSKIHGPTDVCVVAVSLVSHAA